MGTEKYNRSVERTMQLLNAFSAERTSMGLTQLSDALGLPKATVLRLASTLCKYGFLSQDPGSRQYSLGLRLFELGGIVYASFSLRRSASSHLTRLLEKQDHTVFLAVLQGDELLYLDKKENPANPIRFASNAGNRRPPHFGMLGQVLMAHLPDGEVDRLLKKYPLAAFTKKSVTSGRAFKETLRRVRADGFAVDAGVAIEGIGGVAAPVRDFTGDVVAAIGVGFMTSSVNGKEIRRIARDVTEAAIAISREQGYTGGPASPGPFPAG